MSHLVLELALWVLLAFFIGCIIGCLLRRLFAGEERRAVVEGPARAPVETMIAPAAESLQQEPVASAAAPEALAAIAKPARPKGIAAARSGKADNLRRISGVGPKNEKTLHGLGFFHFDQIAAWTSEEIAWVDDHLKFGGRILREEWTEQARLLAEGNEDEFRRLYGTGGVRNKKGETESGSKTRKS
jgi:predicted flap endonuclease-1-like 5' DNA nuclease